MEIYSTLLGKNAEDFCFCLDLFVLHYYTVILEYNYDILKKIMGIPPAYEH